MSLATLLVIVIAVGTTNSVSGEVMRGHFLDRGDGHVIYWAADEVEDGVDAVPVMVMHGGADPRKVGDYDKFLPDVRRLRGNSLRYRRVFMHQRGWGYSTPTGGLANNTMADIMGDMDAIRELLGYDKWAVAGLSTGCHLAFAYGADYPSRCLGVVLRGLDGIGKEEMNYSYNERRGKAEYFPIEWSTMHRFSLAAPGDTVVDRFHRLVIDSGREWEDRVAAARAWNTWDACGASRSSFLTQIIQLVTELDGDHQVGTASLALHQFKHVPNDPKYKWEVVMKRGAVALAGEGVKLALVVGRLDMLGPPAWSERLRNRMAKEGGKVQMEIVEKAGHIEKEEVFYGAMDRAFKGVLQM